MLRRWSPALIALAACSERPTLPLTTDDAGPPVERFEGSDRFDPSKVYVIADLLPAMTGKVIIDLTSPTNLSYGFDGGASNAFIHPVTGKIIYATGTGEVRIFAPDLLERVAGVWRTASPRTNDELVPTPPCESGETAHLLMQAKTGDLFYSCLGDTSRLYRNGIEVPACRPFRQAIDENGVLLCSDTIVSTAVSIPLGERLKGLTAAAGKPGGGFRVVINRTTHADDPIIERWTLTATGALSFEGRYPPHPKSYSLGYTAFDAAGALYWVQNNPRVEHEEVFVFAPDFSPARVAFRFSSVPGISRGGRLIAAP